MQKERITLAEIFKEGGQIEIAFPNPKDVQSFEIYGFLKCYLKDLEKDLINSMEKTR